MEVQGRISKILSTRTGTKSDGTTWQAQEFIFEFFETPEQRWSDKVVLSIMNERIKEYNLHEGDEVKIGFSHGVNEWNGRVFNDVRTGHIEVLKRANTESTAPAQQPSQPAPTAPAPQPAKTDEEASDEEEKDDLPF